MGNQKRIDRNKSDRKGLSRICWGQGLDLSKTREYSRINLQKDRIETIGSTRIFLRNHLKQLIEYSPTFSSFGSTNTTL